MNERAFDFDLIMALAAGEIPPEEAAEMETALDAASRRELASQRAALQALGGLEQPVLDAGERRRLRAGVRAELGDVQTEYLPRAAEGPRAARRYKRRKFRWTRALPALAAAAALVAAVGVTRNGGLRLWEPPMDAQATSAAPAAPALTQLTTTTTAALAAAAPATATMAMREAEAAAAMAEAEAATADMAEAMPAEESMEEALQAEAAREAAAGEAQADEETVEQMHEQDGDAAAAGGAGAGGLEPASFDFSSEELIELADDAELLAGFLDENAGGGRPFPASELEARAGRAGLACWGGVEAAEGGRVLFMGAGLIDGSEVEAYFTEEEGVTAVYVFDAQDCTNLNP